MINKWSERFAVMMNRLMTSNVQVVRRLRQQMKTCRNRRLTIRETSNTFNILFCLFQLVLTKILNMITKFVPLLLSQEQKEIRSSISLQLYDLGNFDSYSLRSLITDREYSIFCYEPEIIMQSSHWKYR
jgi:hypothetical protein